MAYTSFGEFLRILRIKEHQVMGDMAKVLNVKTPFLSAVENGKKNVPEEWIDIISEKYHLSDGEKENLRCAAEESKTFYKINTMKANSTHRKAALCFARSFDEMDDETARKILELLSNTEGESKN